MFCSVGRITDILNEEMEAILNVMTVMLNAMRFLIYWDVHCFCDHTHVIYFT